MSDFGDKLCGRILESADFFQRITLAAIVSEFKDRQLGAAISEDAFSDIEGTDDYLFHAVSGVKEVVSNQSLDAVNGYGSALMTVGDKEYKLSTIDSIHEDLVAMRGSITPKDFGEHLITLSRCYYLSDEAGRGSELYRGAIEELSQSDGVISLFHQIGIIFVPGKTVHDSASESKFPDEEVIELLRETAKKRLTGDDQEYALSCLDF